MAFHKGDVWLVSYPFSDLTTTKVRPAIVVSSQKYHEEQPDIIMAALTSNLSAAIGQCDFVLQDWKAAGVRFPSAFKPVLTTLDPSLIIHRIGSLTPEDLSEIEARILLALGL